MKHFREILANKKEMVESFANRYSEICQES